MVWDGMGWDGSECVGEEKESRDQPCAASMRASANTGRTCSASQHSCASAAQKFLVIGRMFCGRSVLDRALGV